jgi:hypothetical protein
MIETMEYLELLKLYLQISWEIMTRPMTYLYIALLIVIIFLIAFLVDTYNRT